MQFLQIMVYRTYPFAHDTGVGEVKVKCTLLQALRLCSGRTAYRGSRGTALHFHDYGTRRE